MDSLPGFQLNTQGDKDLVVTDTQKVGSFLADL